MKRVITLFLALFLMLSLCVSFTAAESPTPVNYYAMHIAIDGHGHAEVDKIDIVAGSDEIVTFTAMPSEGYHFVGWKIEGTYDNIVEGIVYTPVIKIHPTSDILAIAMFSDATGTVATVDTSPVSPKTGQDSLPIYIVLAILVVSAAGIMISTKNLKRKI